MMSCLQKTRICAVLIILLLLLVLLLLLLSGCTRNKPPTARILYPQDGSVITGPEVSFRGTGTDPEGQRLDYRWDFGDGTTGTGPETQHRYRDGGEYTIRLTVSDPQGASGTVQIRFRLNLPPQAVATIVAQQPGANTAGKSPLLKFTSGEAPLTVQFDGSRSHDPDRDDRIAGFHWDFGDGTTSDQAKPLHTYPTPGEYHVTLTVTDSHGAQASDSLTVTVLPPGAGAGTQPAKLQIDGTIMPGEYQHHYRDPVTGIELHWTIAGSVIYLGLQARTAGWLGLGLAITRARRGMAGLDIILGTVTKSGKTVVRDDYADAPSAHAPDEQLGGHDNILRAYGSLHDGQLTLELVRKLNTEDRYDTPIINGWMIVAFAYSDSNDLSVQHVKRSLVQLNFFTGEVRGLAER